MRRTRNRRHNGGLSLNPMKWFGSEEEEQMAQPMEQPMPQPMAQPAQGGKRKNRCGMWGGAVLMPAPVNYDQVRVDGGQPSEKIMNWATTAGGRRNKSRKSRNNKSRNKSRRNKSRRNKSRKSRRNH